MQKKLKGIMFVIYLFIFIYLFPHHSHTNNVLAMTSIIINVFRNIKSSKLNFCIRDPTKKGLVL